MKTPFFNQLGTAWLDDILQGCRTMLLPGNKQTPFKSEMYFVYVQIFICCWDRLGIVIILGSIKNLYV